MEIREEEDEGEATKRGYRRRDSGEKSRKSRAVKDSWPQ